MGKNLSTKRKVLAGCSVVMIVFSIAMLAGGYNAMLNAILKKQLELVPGTEAYDLWIETPIPLYLKMYLFSIVNPDEFVNGAKPILEEMGPYTFIESHSKVPFGYNNNGTVTYYVKRTWVYDQDLSEGNSLDDVATILNSIPVSATFGTASGALFPSLNKFFNDVNESLIVKATVGDILFYGYEDPILDYLQDLITSNSPILEFLDLSPILYEYDKFAWYYKRNNSLKYDGVYTQFTGETGVDKSGLIDRWNYMRYTDIYNGRQCNHITGSAGEQWPPGLTKTDITFISPDLCMSLTLPYQKEVQGEYDINTYRYYGTAASFKKDDPDCYCIEDDCPVDGLLNVQECKYGSPSYISFPHFLYGDPGLLENVTGLDPSESKHTFFMDIIPELGVPTNVAARMQINLKVVPYNKGLKKIDILKNVPEVMLPVLWFEELAGLDEELGEELESVAFILQTPFFPILFGVFLIISVIGLIISLWPAFKKG